MSPGHSLVRTVFNKYRFSKVYIQFANILYIVANPLNVLGDK